MDFTVAICTYNGANRLPAVFEALAAQVTSTPINWSILVIDNNSQDQTRQVVLDYQQRLEAQSGRSLRYVFEPRQGIGFARQRSIDEAHSELIGFLDDDNLPAPDWVEQAYTFGLAYPRAGAYGGQNHGTFEVSPPPNFKKIAPFLAIIERGNQPLCYTSYQYAYKRVFPPAAGLVVRRQAWLQGVPRTLLLQGQFEQLALPGEDIEALSYIQMAGWEIWYNPAMNLQHVIPQHRLEREYLLKLMRSCGLSRHHTRMLGLNLWQRPLLWLAYLLNDLRKLTTYWLKYRQLLAEDVVAACELELLRGSLWSPFYMWSHQLLQLKRTTNLWFSDLVSQNR